MMKKVLNDDKKNLYNINHFMIVIALIPSCLIFYLVISVWWHTTLQCSYSYSLTFDVVIDSNCQWIYWRSSEGATPSGHAFVSGWTLQPVSEMWTEIGKLLFFHFLFSEIYLAKGLLYFLFFFRTWNYQPF